MNPHIYKLLSDNQPLPKGTEIETMMGGVHVGGRHALSSEQLKSANACPNHMSDHVPFWIVGWRDLHDKLHIPNRKLRKSND